MKIRFIWPLFLLSFLQIAAQDNLIINVQNRQTLSLNGKWHYIVDPYESGFYDYRTQEYNAELGMESTQGAFFHDRSPSGKTDKLEYDFAKSPTLMVPGDWNSQEEELFLYEGTVWYRKRFDLVKSEASNRVFVHFGAANYGVHVYMNSKKLGFHEGGFTPFNYEVTDILREKGNYLVVKVDNKRFKEAVPTLSTDWKNFGGLTRDVNIVELPPEFIQDYRLSLIDAASGMVEGRVNINGWKEKDSEQELFVEIPELGIRKSVLVEAAGLTEFTIKIKKAAYWTPETPKLYKVKLRFGDDEVVDQIGFRTIKTKGSDILLNGKPVFLRGICIHEENPMRGGRAYSKEDARMLLGWAKELNCNFVRLAHYPHNEHMIRMADEMGIMVWEEIPVYWTIDWTNKETLKSAKQQLAEVITRDQNRSSVIIWSMANETPVSEERTVFLKTLVDLARSMDDSRLISAAMEKHTSNDNPLVQIVEDPFAQYVDVISFNQYIGWYDGNPDKCEKVEWKVPYDKPVIVSEFGAGALGGFHADKETVWSEEFQEELYRQTVLMLERIPNLKGVTPWILTDFHSPRRHLPNIQDGWNRKGLISETGNKKKAFFVLRDYYLKKEAEGKK